MKQQHPCLLHPRYVPDTRRSRRHRISRWWMMLMIVKELLVNSKRYQHLEVKALLMAPRPSNIAKRTRRFLHSTHTASQPSLFLPSQPGKQVSTVLAPMVAASDYPFRCLCRQYSNIDLAFTQMWHAKHLIEKPVSLQSHWDLFELESGSTSPASFTKAQLNCFGDSEPLLDPPCERSASGPIVVQLAGHDVEVVTKAALLVAEKSQGQVAGIDLNLGCPQGIARKGRYGAFLMEEDPEIVYAILQNLRRALPENIAVSAKIRLPLDPTKQEERISRLRDTGINFLTIHGRDLKENKTKVRGIHADRMRQIVERASPVPVIANGGIEYASDVSKVLEQTGAAAIMISEGMLERPNLLKWQDHDDIHAQERFRMQMEMAQSYMDWCRFSPPYPGVLGIESGSFCVVRGHLFKMLFPYLQEHRDLRDALASNRCCTLSLAADIIANLRERYGNVSDWGELRSSSNHSSWYRRHRHGENVRHEKNQQKIPDSLTEIKLTVEERKQQIRQRLALMKSERPKQRV